MAPHLLALHCGKLVLRFVQHKGRYRDNADIMHQRSAMDIHRLLLWKPNPPSDALR
jgi:hypothetical protein